MTRLVYVILISAPFVIYYLLRSNYMAAHISNYSDKDLYSVVRRMIAIMKFNGRIHTKIYGAENLPTDGGYVMYPNHQGKYDVLGIISGHKEPCTFVIDAKRAGLPFANEITKILKASRLDKTNLRSQAATIRNIACQVNDGRKFIIFPEGGYNDNDNSVHEFLPGSFKCSVRSKTPIIPVALVDSYKVFGVNSLKKVTTQVHFLEPLYYEDYKDLTTVEIAEIVQEKITSVIKLNEKSARCIS